MVLQTPWMDLVVGMVVVVVSQDAMTSTTDHRTEEEVGVATVTAAQEVSLAATVNR